jgi:hypothetical protein
MDSEKEVHVRAMSAPHSLAPQDEECAAPGKVRFCGFISTAFAKLNDGNIP